MVALTEKLKFRRLPGRGASLAHYYSLYSGPEYLLQVASTGWSERYKRFYYQDIRALVIRRTTTTSTILNISLAFLTTASLAFAFTVTALLPLAIVSLIFALPLFYNLLAGPTCVCHIYTSVQVEKLPSIGRLRSARKMLAQIRPLIEQAQGRLEPATPDSSGLASPNPAPAPPASTPPTPDLPAAS